MSPAKLLIAAGVVLVLVGLLWHFGDRTGLPLGRLPGDLRVERPGFRFHFPLTTCILVSAALSAVLWIVGQFRR